MIGRDHAALAVARDVGPVDIAENRVAGAVLEDHAPVGALVLVETFRHQPAQDRRHVFRRGHLGGQFHAFEHLAPAPPDAFLGQADEIDHALVGFLGRIAKAEYPVLQKDQTLDIGRGAVHLCRFLGQREARHDVGHEPRAAAVDLAADGLPVGLVADRQHRRRMGMVDELVRQESVQQGFDRRIGRSGVE